MDRLLAAVESYRVSALELENASLSACVDMNIRIPLADSRMLTDRILESENIGARAERNVFAIPITVPVRDKVLKKQVVILKPM